MDGRESSVRGMAFGMLGELSMGLVRSLQSSMASLNVSELLLNYNKTK